MKRLLFLLLFPLVVVAQQKELPDTPVAKAQVEQERSSKTIALVQETKSATKGYWLTVAAMGASSAYATFGGYRCRQNNGVEPCTAHYGSFKGTEAARVIGTVGMAGAFYKCRKEWDNSKWCRLFSDPLIVINVGWGVHEQLVSTPKVAAFSVLRKQ